MMSCYKIFKIINALSLRKTLQKARQTRMWKYLLLRIAMLEHATTFLVVGFGVFAFFWEITRVNKHDLSVEL